MIDIHNHLLPGIDDGCTSFDDSLVALKEAETKGIKTIILTPHYIKGSNFACNNKEKEKIFKELEHLVEENNIKIKLYLGNEVYFDNNLYDLINDKEAMTLNNSRYLLFELPMSNKVNNLKEVIFSLRSKGIIPILAHPERYTYIQDNPKELISLVEQGCLLQGNLGSLGGIYGKRAKKCINLLLKHDLIHFMATDAHHPNSKNYLLLHDAIKELLFKVGEQETKILLEENPLKIINNQEIIPKKPKEFKHFFKFF